MTGEEIPGQLDLFTGNVVGSKSEPPTDLVEWALGQEAGYRGDELIGAKTPDFMRGYDEGRASKADYERRYNNRG